MFQITTSTGIKYEIRPELFFPLLRLLSHGGCTATLQAVKRHLWGGVPPRGRSLSAPWPSPCCRVPAVCVVPAVEAPQEFWSVRAKGLSSRSNLALGPTFLHLQEEGRKKEKKSGPADAAPPLLPAHVTFKDVSHTNIYVSCVVSTGRAVASSDEQVAVSCD